MNVCDILSSHLGEQYAIANALNIIAEIESYGDCRHCGKCGGLKYKDNKFALLNNVYEFTCKHCNKENTFQFSDIDKDVLDAFYKDYSI